jgi:hypothetical protein
MQILDICDQSLECDYVSQLDITSVANFENLVSYNPISFVQVDGNIIPYVGSNNTTLTAKINELGTITTPKDLENWKFEFEDCQAPKLAYNKFSFI